MTVGIVCEHGQLERVCPICEKEALLNQYRETIIKYFYDGEIDFRHWSDLLYQLREIDPVLEDMFTDPEAS